MVGTHFKRSLRNKLSIISLERDVKHDADVSAGDIKENDLPQTSHNNMKIMIFIVKAYQCQDIVKT